ncbi:tyrosine-type recombinase/integrase [Niallia taxi]|uniref:tyrosine-type recombinase/integrase n=1 Tax=Niallia taxi TaxID=2499688 RepID=UPI00300BA8A6
MNTVEPIRDLKKLEKIINYLKAKSDRDFIMFLLGIYTGLRISDILKLRVVDVKGQHISIREKKTGKEKKVVIIPELKRELRKYILSKDDHEFLIKSRKGENQPIDRSTAYRILKDAAAHVNLRELGTHSMRKTFGYHFYADKKNVALLQELFNHRDQKTTLRYIGVNQDSLDKQMGSFKYNFNH